MLRSEHEIAAGIAASVVAVGYPQTMRIAIDDAHGVLGPIDPPDDALWIGLGASDELLAATLDGSLYAVPLTDSGRASAFALRYRIAGAKTWDAAGAWVAASDGDAIWISNDGGGSFRKSSPAKNAEVAVVLTRWDGVVVAQGPSGTWITRDAGRAWTESVFEPTRLARIGGLVWNADWACPVSLSADGKTWARETRDLLAVMSLISRDRELSHFDRATEAEHPVFDHLGVERPAPASVPSASHAVVTANPCANDVPAAESDPPAIDVPFLHSGTRCRGVSCMAGSGPASPAPTRRMRWFLNDGLCSAASPDDPTFCADDSSVTRAPGIVLVDSDSQRVAVRRVPDGCAPVSLWNTAGLSLLLCEDPHGARVYAASGDATWSDEGALSFEAAKVYSPSTTGDGAIVMQIDCPGPRCRAESRSPEPVGASAAWREVAVQEASSYRAVGGGLVLAAVRASPGDDDHLRIVVSKPDGGTDTLVAEVALTGDLVDLDVDEHDRLVVWLRAGHESQQWWVSADGVLLPIPPEEQR